MNKISNIWKGYLFALLATIAISNVYIFSKAALSEIELVQFGVYWFGLAIFWNLSYSFASGRYKRLGNLKIIHLKTLLGIGVVEVIATVSVFIAIDRIPNPSIPSFLRNMEPIFIVLLGLVFLREKYTAIEKTGIVLTLIGAVVISYKKSSGIDSFFVDGAQYMLLACAFYAIRTIWVKLVIKKIDPIVINLNKVVALFLAYALFMLSTGIDLSISTFAFWNIFIGSLIGPFLTSYAQYLSLQYIDASRSTLIQSTAGIFTLVFAFIYFGTLPLFYQIIGGIVTIFGIWILIDGKRIMHLKIKQHR